MMYQCCLIALMIAHCVSSPDRRPSYVEDTQNTSQIEPFPGGTERKPNHFIGDESDIQPLIEQDIYDDNDESEDNEGDTDDDRPVTVGYVGYEDDDGRNVIIHDGPGPGPGPGPVRISTLSNSAILASATAHYHHGLDQLNDLRQPFEPAGPKPFPQQHVQNPSETLHQMHRPADANVQFPSSLSTLTTDTGGSNSLPSTDLSELTLPEASTGNVSLEVTNSNLSLSTQRATRKPTSRAQLSAKAQSMANVGGPIDLEHKPSPGRQPTSDDAPTRRDPSGGFTFYTGTSNDTLTTVTTTGQHRHRTINSMNLNPTTPAMVVKPVGEHRKLLKSTGPILNYVFDHHPPYYKSNYYNARYGPHFETDNVTNITVQNGDTLYLSCRISLLQDKTVSWVRRKSGESALQLLTVGKQTYSGDSRYQIEFQYPNNWRLKISQANKNDEGVYECQISTHPPKVIIYYLHVNAPEVAIVDEEGGPLYDKYYEVGSTIKLMCKIRHISMLRSVVYWVHNDNILNHDTTRGGISVKTNLTSVGANSTLFVAKVTRQDSGSYTCSIGPNQHYSISVHVLNGTANPYGIYQRSCAFSIILQAVDLWFVVRSLLFLLFKLSMGR